jgi:DNA-binding response OmpR family regulator
MREEAALGSASSRPSLPVTADAFSPRARLAAGPVSSSSCRLDNLGGSADSLPTYSKSSAEDGLLETNHKTILVIEDEPDIIMGLRDGLEFEGFRIISTGLGKEGIRLVSVEKPSCIILDLMLPDLNGFRVCEAIRDVDSVVPIIILSARSQESDKIRGLDAGADDYVTKPFSIGELIARINAIFRRFERAVSDIPEEMTIGKVTVDTRTQELTRGRTKVTLSFYEFELLKYLYERAGEPVSRDTILDKIWGHESYPTSRTVDNFIVKLRKHIEDNPAKPRHILTIYGQGYKLVP